MKLMALLLCSESDSVLKYPHIIPCSWYVQMAEGMFAMSEL